MALYVKTDGEIRLSIYCIFSGNRCSCFCLYFVGILPGQGGILVKSCQSFHTKYNHGCQIKSFFYIFTSCIKLTYGPLASHGIVFKGWGRGPKIPQDIIIKKGKIVENESKYVMKGVKFKINFIGSKHPFTTWGHLSEGCMILIWLFATASVNKVLWNWMN